MNCRLNTKLADSSGPFNILAGDSLTSTPLRGTWEITPDHKRYGY